MKLKGMFNLNSVKKKIILGFLSVIIINLIVFLGVEFVNGYKEFEEQSLDKSYAYAEHIEKVISPIGIENPEKIQLKIVDLLESQYELASYIGVLDKNFNYVANTDKSKIGISFKNENIDKLIDENKPASFKVKFNGENEYFSVVPLYNTKINGLHNKEKSDAVASASVKSKNEVVSSASISLDIPGLVVVKMDNSKMLRGVKERIYITILISIIVFFVSIVIAVLISSSITKPLLKIRDYLRNMSKGDLTKVIDIKSKDEILALAKDIDGTNISLKNIICKIRNVSEDLEGYSKEVNISSKEIAAVSEEISSSVNSIAESSNVQSENLIEATGKIKDFSLNLNIINKKINSIENNSNEIKLFADKGSQGISEVILSIDDLTFNFKGFIDEITNLTNNINNISSITKTINNVARQTNLLSLNASIESARYSGEGRGFKIVAEEIKKLARQTLESSEDITQLIGEISKATSSFGEMANNISMEFLNQHEGILKNINIFKDIVNKINTIIPEIKEIATLTNNSVKMKDGILNNIEYVTSTSEELASSMEEVSQSIEQQSSTIINLSDLSEVLNSISNDMVGMIEKFTLD